MNVNVLYDQWAAYPICMQYASLICGAVESCKRMLQIECGPRSLLLSIQDWRQTEASGSRAGSVEELSNGKNSWVSSAYKWLESCQSAVKQSRRKAMTDKGRNLKQRMLRRLLLEVELLSNRCWHLVNPVDRPLLESSTFCRFTPKNNMLIECHLN